MQLRDKHCVPCEGGTEALPRMIAESFLKQVQGWALSEDARSISKSFSFPDFASAMVFAQKIAEVAEQEGHHPDLTISWGKVSVQLSTHAIGGLSENDFILAAKVDHIA